jgi:transcriptional regulator with PAS, ATPase and Fis domain
MVASAAAARGNDGGHATLAVIDPTPAGVPAPVTRFARSPVSVLILGETGTGKEVLARTIHALSGRGGSFVGINSAALSESLLESELFGHERGAFTGATATKPGLLEIAARGTVFLDEIGDLPPALQAKLLRAIETREVYRVGGLKPIALDVRFLAATHRDLEAEVAAGRFRADLYYRLNGITLKLAPLRERRAAISRLARGFLADCAAAAHRPAPRLGVDAIDRLIRYDWPGNVRELRMVMERALLLCEGDEIAAGAILVGAAPAPAEPADFTAVARRHRGNVSAIARELSTSRSQVHRLAQRFGIALARLRLG